MCMMSLLLVFLLLPSLISYHINVGSTGLMFPYTLGALAYIKTCLKPENCKFIGVSGGTWCSLLYHLEPNITDPELLWTIFLGNKTNTIHLLNRKSMVTFQETVAKNFKERYKNVDVKQIPISIITTKVEKYGCISNVKIDDFETINDLVDYCMCSSYIPFISGNGLYKKYKNAKYIDGAIFKNRKLLFDQPFLNLHKYTWKRKHSLRNNFFLDFNSSQELFYKGWQDAEQNLHKFPQ